jgi:hypothetical protein
MEDRMNLRSWVMSGVLLTGICAHAQSKTGSVLVYTQTPSGFVIAADSRSTWTDGRPADDNQCKIAAFKSNRVVFAVGMGAAYANTGPLDLEPSWDTFDLAKEVVLEKKWSDPVPVDAQDAVKRLAAAWQTKMVARWQEVKRFDPGRFAEAVHNHGVLTMGIFAIAYQGQVATSVSSIVDNNGTISVVPLTDPNCAVDLCAIGKTDTYRRNMSPPFMPGSPPITRAIGLVDKTIKVDTTGVIGGKTDALELLNDGTINWKQRKDNCPDSRDASVTGQPTK